MKRLLSLCLSIIIIFSLAAPVSAVEKAISLKVGEEKVVDVSKYITNVSHTSYKYITDSPMTVADVSVNDLKAKIHGICSGEEIVTVESSDGESIDLHIKVTGKASKNKKYNKISSVLSDVKTKTFSYENVYIDTSRPGVIYFTAGKITNMVAGTRVPDVKIAFYDKHKKKVGTYQSTKDTGSTCHVELNGTGDNYSLFMCGISANSMGISDKKFKSIKYFRILEV